MTFSIAAFCPRTRSLGAAMATSSMAAGARVLFLEPDHGLVLTQARTDPRLGPQALARLAAGRSATEALSEVLAGTPHGAWRQLAIVDRNGAIAQATGASVMAPKGARLGGGAIAVGNGIAGEAVLEAMVEGFKAIAELPLADRLLAGLERGLAAGGEGIPLRSAALKVSLPGVPFVPIDLRVDFSERPIADLKRCWAMWSAMAEGYVQRALDPANALPAEAIEAHSSPAT